MAEFPWYSGYLLWFDLFNAFIFIDYLMFYYFFYKISRSILYVCYIFLFFRTGWCGIIILEV